MKIRKFFDASGRETSEELAVTCQELEVSPDGNVLSEANYRVGPSRDRFNPDKLREIADASQEQ